MRVALITPPAGYRLIYADYRQQEFGIAGALSGDKAMWHAYCTGDFYLAFAKLAGALPPDASTETGCAQLTAKQVKDVRNQYKQCCLAILYGQGAHGLAARIGQSVILAQRLIDQHRNMFPVFWKWSARTINQTMYMNKIWTSLGWVLHIQEGVLNLEDTNETKRNRLKKKNDYPNVRSLANYQMQGHGSDILRIACLHAMADGLAISATVHDAIMILAPEDSWGERQSLLVDGMREASRAVLGDAFTIDVDVKNVKHGEYYGDDSGRGDTMWNIVQSLAERSKMKTKRVGCVARLIVEKMKASLADLSIEELAAYVYGDANSVHRREIRRALRTMVLPEGWSRRAGQFASGDKVAFRVTRLKSRYRPVGLRNA